MRQKAKNAGKEGVKGTWREIARFEFAYSVPGAARRPVWLKTSRRRVRGEKRDRTL